MKKNSIFWVLGITLFVLGSMPMQSQTVTAQVEGTVTDGGKALPSVSVVLTNTGTGRNFKTKTDKNGKFSMVGVPYGEYEVEVTSSSGEKLFKQKNSVAPSDNSVVANLKIDISQTKSGGTEKAGEGGQGTPGQPPAPKYTKEQIEEIKKQNEKAGNMNSLIQQAQTAMNAKNWQEAIGPLQQLTTMDPTGWQFFSALADAQLNLGQYDQAVESYQKGVQAAESMTTVDPRNPSSDPAKKKAGEAKMLTNEGNAYLKLHKNAEAVAAYTKAASMDANPGTAYFNLCATQYNTGNVEGALDACDKAIAADPNKADAYFIKGSLLIAGSKQDKDGKITAPPGTAEALNKYLELAPDGGHANDVKQMLGYIGSKIETTYKKKGK